MSSPGATRRNIPHHHRGLSDREPPSLESLAEYTRSILQQRSTATASRASSIASSSQSTPVSSYSETWSTGGGGAGSQFESKDIRCCCGLKTCASVIRNEAIVSELQDNVQTAAQLGQALLRHADDAEKIRIEMTAKINNLEEQNKRLELENTISIDQNRNLVNRLESLNENVSQSDTKVRELSADLDDTRAELDRVSARAARAEILEAQLSVLETEQEDLRRNLSITQEDERTAIARWQKVEKQAAELQEQCDRLENEYLQEKVRSQKLASKISSRKSVREIQQRSTNMEGAAISNFMKEILQDNQQLQAGTAELRQLLIIAQDEIGSLREQVLTHQRLDGSELSSTPLAYEFPASPRKISQEVHVHHHHHVAKDPKGSVRKVRRKVKGVYSRSPQTPTPAPWPQYESSVAPSSKRSSIQSSTFSNHTRSSSFANTVVSDTPASTYKEPSIWDGPYTVDDSRPTSAGSSVPTGITSPIPVEPRKTKKKSHGRHHSSFSTPPFSALNEEDLNEGPQMEEGPSPTEEVPEELIPNDSDVSPRDEDPDTPDAFDLSTPSPFLATTIPGRKLVRSTSHESLLIPETAPIEPFAPAAAKAPFQVAGSSAAFSALQAVITPVTANNMPARYSSSTYNRLLLSSIGGNNKPVPRKKESVVGSWFWNRFSSKPVKETASSSLARHVEAADDSSITTVSDSGDTASIRSQDSAAKKLSSSASPKKRTFGPPSALMVKKSSAMVLATPIDEDSLAESLAE